MIGADEKADLKHRPGESRVGWQGLLVVVGSDCNARWLVENP